MDDNHLESSVDNTTRPLAGSKEDPLASMISNATNAANAFGFWLSNTAKEKAPELYEKTSKLSNDVLKKTKTAASGAFEKTAVFAKKASFVVEQFVEKQLEDHGMISRKSDDQGEEVTGLEKSRDLEKLPNLAE